MQVGFQPVGIYYPVIYLYTIISHYKDPHSPTRMTHGMSFQGFGHCSNGDPGTGPRMDSLR